MVVSIITDRLSGVYIRPDFWKLPFICSRIFGFLICIQSLLNAFLVFEVGLGAVVKGRAGGGHGSTLTGFVWKLR